MKNLRLRYVNSRVNATHAFLLHLLYKLHHRASYQCSLNEMSEKCSAQPSSSGSRVYVLQMHRFKCPKINDCKLELVLHLPYPSKSNFVVFN